MVDLDRFADILSSTKFSFLFLALFLDMLERPLLAYKWNVLLAAKKMNLAFGKAVKIYFVSTFVGTFLPSSIGGDIFRAYSLHKNGINSSEAISSIFVDRIISLLSSLLIAFASVILYSKVMHDNNLLQSVLLVIAVFSVFLFVIMNKPIMQFFINKLQVFKLQRIQKKIEQLYSAFIGYNAHKPVLFYVFILSFLFQLVRVLVTYAGSLALNQNIDIVYFFIFVPIIILATVLPISVAGVGVREGAFVYFFSQVGMSASEAFTLALLLYAVTMIAVLPGGIIYAVEGVAVKDVQTIKRGG
jgi:hypothetical protein